MENKRLFGKICFLHRQMSRENCILLSEYGVSPVQMHTLVFIHKNNKKSIKVYQKDIEKELNLRPSSVSTLLNNLEKNELIVRNVADGDARAKELELTEKAKYICIKDKLLMESCDGAIQSALSEVEQEQFEILLNKIINCISKQ